MMWFHRQKPWPLCIDLSADGVRVVQLGRDAGGALRVAAAAQRKLPVSAGGDPVASLREAIDAVGAIMRLEEFRGREAIVALPSHLLATRTVRLDVASDERASEIPPALREAFDFELAGAPLQIISSGPVVQAVPNGQETIGVAVDPAHAQIATQRLAAIGLSRTTLEAGAVGLCRAMNLVEPANAEETFALLQVDGSASVLAICREGRIQFLRRLSFAFDEVLTSLAATLSISLEEARTLRRRAASGGGTDSVARAVADSARAAIEKLVTEVNAGFRYHAVTFRGRHPTRLLLGGSWGGDGQLAQTLSEQLGVACQPINLLQYVDASAMRPADREPAQASQWSVAVALALNASNSPTNVALLLSR